MELIARDGTVLKTPPFRHAPMRDTAFVELMRELENSERAGSIRIEILRHMAEQFLERR